MYVCPNDVCFLLKILSVLNPKVLSTWKFLNLYYDTRFEITKVLYYKDPVLYYGINLHSWKTFIFGQYSRIYCTSLIDVVIII